MNDMAIDGMTARHMSRSVEHYSPAHIVSAARETLGAIDLDPASCAIANDTIGAWRIFTEDDDGFARLWDGRVFLNPPGGKVDGESQQKRWWFKLVDGWIEGHVSEAIFVGFSVEIMQTTQVKRPTRLPIPAELPHCFPSRRVAYMHAVDGALVKGSSPPHSSVIVYLPPRASVDEWWGGQRRFSNAFAAIGAICGPASPGMWGP